MLSKEDTRRLAQLERQLRHDDPEFCERMSGAAEGPRRTPVRRRVPVALMLAASVILTAAMFLATIGWWIPATVAVLWATVIVAAIAYRCFPTHDDRYPPVW